MTIKFGPAIAVDGKRPDWLHDNDDILLKDKGANVNPWYESAGPLKAGVLSWGDWVQAIKLPVDHWAYVPLDAGFVPWICGETPADWDGGAVMLADGAMWNGPCVWWNLEPANERRVIGYRKAEEAQPSPADTVTVGRITRNEADALIRRSDHDIFVVLNNFGIIRPDTKAWAIATKTGLSVKDVEAVLAAVSEMNV